MCLRKTIARWFPVLLLSSLLLSACGGMLPAEVLGAGGAKAADVAALRARTVFVGTVEAISETAWTISGREVLVNEQTRVSDGIQVGDLVKVKASAATDGTLTALEIRLVPSDQEPSKPPKPGEEFVLLGAVESIGDTSWMIQGLVFAITTDTKIKGAPAVGDLVTVHAFVEADGTFTARKIELAKEAELPSGVGEARFTGTVESIGAESWIVSGMTLLVNSETRIDAEIVVGDEVKVEASVAADGTLTARAIHLVREHGQRPSPRPGEIEFFGLVEAIADGSWTIQGRVVIVTSETKLDSTIVVGDFVSVRAAKETDGSLTALEIRKASPRDLVGRDGRVGGMRPGDGFRDGRDHHGGDHHGGGGFGGGGGEAGGGH